MTDKCNSLNNKLQTYQSSSSHLLEKYYNIIHSITNKSKKISKELIVIKQSSGTIKTETTNQMKEMSKFVVKQLGEVSKRFDDMKKKYMKEMIERKKLFNALQELKGNIRVLCRVRPLIEKEKEYKYLIIVHQLFQWKMVIFQLKIQKDI